MKLYQNLSELHEAVLLGTPHKASAFVKGNEFLSPQARLQIYIDGYRSRLANAIEADFNCLKHLAGEQEFNALVKSYIEAVPPNHYSLDQYHIRLPQYLQTIKCHNYIQEMAALESAIAEVFWMPHSQALTAEELKKASPEHMGNLRLNLRKASKLMQFDYNCESYLQKFRANKNPQNKPQKARNFLFVYRHENTVMRAVLTAFEFEILSCFAKGFSISESIEQVFTLNSQYNKKDAASIQTSFANWIKRGYFESYHFPKITGQMTKN
jgi:hypothetical protein